MSIQTGAAPYPPAVVPLYSGRSFTACVVTGKFYSGVPTAGEVSHEAEAGQERALRRVRDALSLGPRDKYSAPLTTSQESVHTVTHTDTVYIYIHI